MNLDLGTSRWLLALVLFASVSLSGCASQQCGGIGRTKEYGPEVDRPFVLGQNTDAFWETQQTNAEAADFVFYDHEFVGDTARFAPAAKRHIESVALRLDHVPFPIVIEKKAFHPSPDLDRARRRYVLEQLSKMGFTNMDRRVIIAPAYVEGFTAMEGERAYQSILSGRNNGSGGGGGGGGGGRGF
jgi:hypothetical protein